MDHQNWDQWSHWRECGFQDQYAPNVGTCSNTDSHHHSPSRFRWGHQVGNVYPALSIVPDMELVLNKHFSWMKEKNESMNQSVNRKLSTLRQAFLLWAPHEAWCWEVSSFTPQSVDPQILSPGASRAWRTPWEWCLHSEEMPGGRWVPGKILLGLGGCSLWPSGLYSVSDGRCRRATRRLR